MNHWWGASPVSLQADLKQGSQEKENIQSCDLKPECFYKYSFISVVLCYGWLSFSVYGMQTKNSMSEYLWWDTFNMCQGPKGRNFQREMQRAEEFLNFHTISPVGSASWTFSVHCTLLECCTRVPESLRGTSHFHSWCTAHTFFCGVICPEKETITFL